jgi:hypothetical protein
MTYNNESIEVQTWIANILLDPVKEPQDLYKQLFPDRSNTDITEILSTAKSFLDPQSKVTPNIVHRLKLCWTALRQADVVIRKTKPEEFPEIIKNNFIEKLLKDVFPATQIHPVLSEAVCERLSAGKNGAFLRHYSIFLKQNKPKPLDLLNRDKNGVINKSHLKRIIIWLLRKNRFQYVDLGDDNSIMVNFPYLVNYVKEEITKLCRGEKLRFTEDLMEQISNETDNWLSKNCILGENVPYREEDRKELVSNFQKEFKLTNRIFVANAKNELTQKILELESVKQELEEENSKLKEQIELLKKSPNDQKLNTEPITEKVEKDGVDKGLVEFLKIINSKYSIDALREVNLGGEHSITIKNFLGHFFYALRKSGLTSYPDDDEFMLDYNHSNLYRCIDFEILPGDEKRVIVEVKGWGFKKDNKITPIKKATVKGK